MVSKRYDSSERGISSIFCEKLSLKILERLTEQALLTSYLRMLFFRTN